MISRLTYLIADHRLLLCAFATVCAPLLAFGIIAGNAWAQPTRLSTGGEFSYSVELGESINMEFALDNDLEVDEAQVVVRPIGLNSVSTYGYGEIERDDGLRVTYELPTASPRYFPPGTAFGIRYVLRADGETVLETQEYAVDYLDERHRWERIGDGQLEIIYYGINGNAIQLLYRDTVRNLERIKPALGVENHPRLRAIIFPNIRELTRYGPTISQSAADGLFFGGFAYSRYHLTIMASPSVSVLTHELTHLLHDVVLESPATVRAPAWLTEGIATYMETGNRERLPRSLRHSYDQSGIRRLREMSTVPGRRADINTFYRQSGDFVGFLAETHGDASIGTLLAELADGAKLDDALTTVYGGNLDELDNQWREQYGFPPVGVRESTERETSRSVPPTIVGVPTPERGTTVILESRADAVGGGPETVPERAPRPTGMPEIEPVDMQEATRVPSTPTADEGYVTSPIGREFRPNTTMILVFFLLALGFGALLFRRMRAP